MKKRIKQHQDYDKILKENIEIGILSLLSKKYDIKAVKITPLSTVLPRTKEKRVDFAVLAEQVRKEDNYILHLEFQTENDELMHVRMFEYYESLYHQYRLPIEQYVIYLGKPKPKMIDKINHKRLKYDYTIIYLKEIDADVFINSNKPEEIILSILCDFKGKSSKKIITRILEKLTQTTENKRSLQKYLRQLEMLSNLRNLQTAVIEEVRDMPILYDIKTDLRYQQGVEETKQEWENTQKSTVKKLLLFGVLTNSQIAEAVNVPLEFVKKVKKEIEKQ